MRFRHRNTTSQRLPRGVLLLALMCMPLAFAVAAIASGVIGAGGDPEIEALERAEGPATKHVKIGEGTLPRNGRFELYRATTASGEECFGIMLFNQPAGLDEGVLFEGCGSPTQASIASNTGHGETILYGRVPEHADKIEIDVPGKAKRVFKAKDSAGDIPIKYFVTAYEGKLTRATAKVTSADGEEIATQDIPLPAR